MYKHLVINRATMEGAAESGIATKQVLATGLLKTLLKKRKFYRTGDCQLLTTQNTII